MLLWAIINRKTPPLPLAYVVAPRQFLAIFILFLADHFKFWDIFRQWRGSLQTLQLVFLELLMSQRSALDQCHPLYKSGSFQFLCLDSMLDICSPNLLMGSFISFYLRFLCLWLPQKKILSSAPFSSKEEKLFATERKKKKRVLSLNLNLKHLFKLQFY